MTASQVVEKLNAMITLHGDCDVYVYQATGEISLLEDYFYCEKVNASDDDDTLVPAFILGDA